MEAIDLLTNRRSVLARNIVEPGPGPADLDRILTAGLRVPDHGRLGPWQIQILHKPAQAEIGDLVAELYVREQGEQAKPRMVEFERQRLQRAPVLLAVTARIEEPHAIPVMEQRLSGGALCMNILNAAHALGYCAQWLTEWPAYHDEVKRALGHDAQTDIIGFIYIGSPKGPPADRLRPAIGDRVTEWTGRNG